MLTEENIANIQKPNGIQIERLCQLKIQIYVYICKKKREVTATSAGNSNRVIARLQPRPRLGQYRNGIDINNNNKNDDDDDDKWLRQPICSHIVD